MQVQFPDIFSGKYALPLLSGAIILSTLAVVFLFAYCCRSNNRGVGKRPATKQEPARNPVQSESVGTQADTGLDLHDKSKCITAGALQPLFDSLSKEIKDIKHSLQQRQESSPLTVEKVGVLVEDKLKAIPGAFDESIQQRFKILREELDTSVKEWCNDFVLNVNVVGISKEEMGEIVAQKLHERDSVGLSKEDVDDILAERLKEHKNEARGREDEIERLKANIKSLEQAAKETAQADESEKKSGSHILDPYDPVFADARNSRDHAKKEAADLREKLSQTQAQLDDLRAKQDKTASVPALRAELVSVKKARDEARQEIGNFEKKRVADRESWQKQRKELNTENGSVNKHLEQSQKDVKALKDQLERARADAEQAKRSKASAAPQSTYGRDHNVESLKEKMDGMQVRLDKQYRQSDAYAEELQRKAEEINDLRAAFAKANAAGEGSASLDPDSAVKLMHLQDQNEELQGEMARVKNRLNKVDDLNTKLKYRISDLGGDSAESQPKAPTESKANRPETSGKAQEASEKTQAASSGTSGPATPPQPSTSAQSIPSASQPTAASHPPAQSQVHQAPAAHEAPAKKVRFVWSDEPYEPQTGSQTAPIAPSDTGAPPSNAPTGPRAHTEATGLGASKYASSTAAKQAPYTSAPKTGRQAERSASTTMEEFMASASSGPRAQSQLPGLSASKYSGSATASETATQAGSQAEQGASKTKNEPPASAPTGPRAHSQPSGLDASKYSSTNRESPIFSSALLGRSPTTEQGVSETPARTQATDTGLGASRYASTTDSNRQSSLFPEQSDRPRMTLPPPPSPEQAGYYNPFAASAAAAVARRAAANTEAEASSSPSGPFGDRSRRARGGVNKTRRGRR